jgi:uncharacterized phiE125 gp8 family phage protein
MIDASAAKAWLKVETNTDDALIGGLVTAAIAHIEKMTGKFLSVKPFTQELAGFPCRHPYSLRLTRAPVVTVSAVTYDPADGTDPVELADYRLVEGLNGALLPAFGQVWPSTLAGPSVVRITGTAGYGDGEAPELDQACLMLVAHWYQNREAVNVGANTVTELPLGVQALIGPYRPIGLA